MEINELFKLLTNSTSEELFGSKGKSHKDYIKFSLLCHPDKNDSSEAAECFKLLQSKVNGEDHRNVVKIRQENKTYEVLADPIAVGDISNFFVDKDSKFVLKVSDARYSHLMKNEETALKLIKPDRKEFPGMASSIARLNDCFDVTISRNHGKKRAHKLYYDPDFVPLTQVLKGNPNGLDLRNFGWIFKRILYSLHVVHSHGYVHGALMPDHYLVNKVDHRGTLIDFIHSVPHNKPVKVTVKDRQFYPEEILKKTPASFETDIYMAGRLGYCLLGKTEIPGRINTLLNVMISERQTTRPHDALDLHDILVDILKYYFGPPQFVELTGV